MSARKRTDKHRKCGWDYWSARPFNKHGFPILGPVSRAFHKKRTHKAERRMPFDDN